MTSGVKGHAEGEGRERRTRKEIDTDRGSSFLDAALFIIVIGHLRQRTIREI